MAVIYSNDFSQYTTGQNLESNSVVNDFGQGADPTTDVQLNSNWSNIKALRNFGGSSWGNFVFLEPPSYTGDFEYTVRAGTSGRVGMLFRSDSNGSTFPNQAYLFQVIPNAANEVRIFRITSSTTADLVSQTSSAGLNQNDMSLKVRMEGSNIKTYINDVLHNDYTDPSPFTTYGGFGGSQFSSTMYWTDVVIDDLTVPPPASTVVGGVILVK